MKRYDVSGSSDFMSPVWSMVVPDGEWVLYDDAAAEIERLRVDLDEAEDENQRHREARTCVTCGGTICPPMQCGPCIERGEIPEGGAPWLPVTATLRSEIERLRAEVERLRTIVERLPKTADGVPVAPGMVYFFARRRNVEYMPVSIIQAFAPNLVPEFGPSFGECFSTIEGAEDAAKAIDEEVQP